MIWSLNSRIRRCYVCCCTVVTTDGTIVRRYGSQHKCTTWYLLYVARRWIILFYSKQHRKRTLRVYGRRHCFDRAEFKSVLERDDNFYWKLSDKLIITGTGDTNKTVSSSNSHTWWDVLLLLRWSFLWNEYVLCVCFVLDTYRFCDGQ